MSAACGGAPGGMTIVELLWWHWVVLGLALIGAEMVVPTFFLLWFGLGALLVGGVLGLAPELGLSGQVLLWTASSLVLTVLWFRYFKPRTKTQSGSSAAQIVGEVGLLTRAVAPFERGEVRFQKPLGGSDTWACIADEAIAAGQRVRVQAVEGSLLRIVKN